MLRAILLCLLPTLVWAEDDAGTALVQRVLAVQTLEGSIPDQLDGRVVNVDSNFLYLLEGLAAHAEVRNSNATWEGIVRGLRWLALRQWGEDDALPGAFPDALPLEGRGQPLGSPPVAAVGATAARFVALVARLPNAPEDLRLAAKRAWDGLHRWNLGEDGCLWNAWELDPNGRWFRRDVRYAADQADYLVGRAGALHLGFKVDSRNPFRPFSRGALAIDGRGHSLRVDSDGALGAWVVLAFDGPRIWRREAIRRLTPLPNVGAPLLALAALTQAGSRRAAQRLHHHVNGHPFPLEHEDQGRAEMNVTGFVLRAMAPRLNQKKGLEGKPLRPRVSPNLVITHGGPILNPGS